MNIEVVHNTAQSRFQSEVDGLTCVADYRLRGQVMQMTHTGVPTQLEGRGIASKLVQAAVEHAKANDLRIDPQCSYVVTWMQRHPEAASLLA